MKQVEEHEVLLHRLRVEHAEEYNMIKTKLETDVQVHFHYTTIATEKDALYLRIRRDDVDEKYMGLFTRSSAELPGRGRFFVYISLLCKNRHVTN